ncbi:MAG: FAD-dependent oxidoreductase [Candidatus Saccharimonas sp.]|nr:FAD-dependent oxidoreductase [Candidatus Saccharimonas sp.]
MHIVIVGGGFGGIKAALELAKDHGNTVTLISDKDHFVYYPSLYAVATGGARRQSFVPLSEIVAGTRVKFIQDTITTYDPERRVVASDTKHYSYDRVIFALGVITSYFGIKGLADYSFGIKSHDEIIRFRKHLHDELVSERKIDKQYVVVGAGPTGVELAASLANYIDHIAKAHKVRHSRIRIKLVEAAPRVLPRMSEFASASVHQHLTKLGVDVLVNEKVEWQDDDEVSISGRSFPTRTVVWTSGVANHPFFAAHHSFNLSPNGKVIVDEHMQINPSTYVIGDNAFTPFSGLAQTALHDAIYAADDIRRAKHQYLRPAYKPFKPAVAIPVGKRWAVMEWNWICVRGYVGHLIRRCADFIGYNDVLPAKTAFSAWRASEAREDLCDICQNTR